MPHQIKLRKLNKITGMQVEFPCEGKRFVWKVPPRGMSLGSIVSQKRWDLRIASALAVSAARFDAEALSPGCLFLTHLLDVSCTQLQFVESKRLVDCSYSAAGSIRSVQGAL